MKKLCFIFLTIFTTLMLCSCTLTEIPSEEILPEDEPTYKIVTPTMEEIEELHSKYNDVFSYGPANYNCETDNTYDKLTWMFFLDCVVPEYMEEIKQYITQPFVERGSATLNSWEKTVHENDPLGYFDEIPEACRDENGIVQMDLVYKYRDEINDSEPVVIGYNMIPAPFFDWLIEGVWNGKVNHDAMIELKNTLCYYYDGFYYVQVLSADIGRGGGYRAEVHSITDKGNGKYEVVYSVIDIMGEEEKVEYVGKAEMALKESKDGFRFWSIYKMTCEDA